MGVCLAAVEIRAGAELVADGNIGDVEAHPGSRRQALVDVEGVERIDAIIGVSRIGSTGA